MVACRLFAAGVAVLGLTAASASAQCCPTSYGAMPAGYAMPVGYGAPVGGCCGPVGGVYGAPVGFASTGMYQPAGMYGTVAAADTGRRGLFGRLLGGRRASPGVVTAGYAAGTPVGAGFSPMVSPVGFSQPISMGTPTVMGGMAMASSGLVPETVMPASASVIGSPALTPAGYTDFSQGGSFMAQPVVQPGTVMPAQGIMPGQAIMPTPGIMSGQPIMPGQPVFPGQAMAYGGCPPVCDPCVTTGSVGRERRGLLGRFRR